MKKYFLFPAFAFIVSCSSSHEPTLEDYIFLKGKWHSVGTDAFEEWSLVQDSLISKTYIIKNDSTLFIDQSCIIKSKPLKLITHLNNASKQSNVYELKYNSIDKVWEFKNESAFPQVLYYAHKPEQNNIYAYVVNNGKKLEFLYESKK